MQQTRATNATACLQRKWSDYFFQIVKEQTAPGFKKPEPSKHPIRLVLASLRWPIRRMQDEHPPFIPCAFILAFGGGERDRTDDPLLAKQVLSQLSYTPV